MGIIEGNTTYKLKRGLPYKSSGGSEVASMIELREPGQEHVKYYLRLKQMLTQSQMSLAKHAGMMQDAQQAIGDIVKPLKDRVEDLEAQAAEDQEGIALGLLSSDIDISAWITAFKKMACSHVRQSICVVDGKTPMTSALWDTLHPDDSFDMSVRWISFFGMPSEEGKKTSSDQQSDSLTAPVEA
jgi:hypothetical protein